MRRLTRRLLNALTVLSLLLCLATASLWMRSYWTADQASLRTVHRFPPLWTDEHVAYGVQAERGSLKLFRRRGAFGVPPSVLRTFPHQPGERQWVVSHLPPRPVPVSWWFDAEHITWFHAGNVDDVDEWSVPLWLLALAAAVPPARRIFKGRRTAPGLCPTCSYNLTANTSGVCPECGTAIAKATA